MEFYLLLLLLPLIGLALQSRSPDEHEQAAEEYQGMQPYFIDVATITKAENYCGLEWRWKDAKDCAMLLHLDVGQSFEPELYIGGDFKKQAGTISDWGAAFKIDEFVGRAGLQPTLNDDNEIRREVLQALVGMKIARIRYVYGYKKKTDDEGRRRLGYSDYDRAVPVNPDQGIHTTEDAKAKVEELFLTDVEKGFPSDYAPKVFEEEMSKKGNGKPSSSSSSSSELEEYRQETTTVEPDDDLPF